MDDVLQQLGIDHIFSAPYNSKSNRKMVLHKHLEPTLKKQCENAPEMNHLALVIAKKTLDENTFRNAQKTTDHPAPNKLETEFI